MSQFNDLERKLAIALDNFPAIRSVIKFTYQYINYLSNIHKNNVRVVHHEAVIIGKKVSEKVSFFGYYDKSPWSKSGKYILFHQLSSSHKELEIVVRNIKKETNNIVGITETWNWQQGAMLQWLNSEHIIFNCIVDNNLGSKVIDINGKLIKKFDFPVQSISPNGDYYVSLNYLRLAKLRPDYGYKVDVKNFSGDMPFIEDGLWNINTENGENLLIVSISKLISFQTEESMNEAQHKVNHASVSPNGRRILFMHRWINSNGKFSRLFSISPNGSELKLLLSDRMISHYSWHDDSHFVAWARTKEDGDHYYYISDISNKIEIIGEGVLDVFGDGHPSFSPDGRWIITDTYPGRDRKQSLHLYDNLEKKFYEVSRLFLPWKYRGYNRCDLHPRWSHDGLSLSIDSIHEGKRSMYTIDISKLISKKL